MRYSSKRKEDKKKRLANLMNGTGLYLYENNTDADLSLPKPSAEGFKTIRPRGRFTGDSYFMSYVKTPLCLIRFIEEIKTEENKIESIDSKLVEIEAIEEKKEEKKETKTINKRKRRKSKKKVAKGKKMKEKLILDQPEVVTISGKMEQVDVEEEKKEASEVEAQEEKLLTENPSGNIEIISE